MRSRFPLPDMVLLALLLALSLRIMPSSFFLPLGARSRFAARAEGVEGATQVLTKPGEEKEPPTEGRAKEAFKEASKEEAKRQVSLKAEPKAEPKPVTAQVVEKEEFSLEALATSVQSYVDEITAAPEKSVPALLAGSLALLLLGGLVGGGGHSPAAATVKPTIVVELKKEAATAPEVAAPMPRAVPPAKPPAPPSTAATAAAAGSSGAQSVATKEGVRVVKTALSEAEHFVEVAAPLAQKGAAFILALTPESASALSGDILPKIEDSAAALLRQGLRVGAQGIRVGAALLPDAGNFIKEASLKAVPLLSDALHSSARQARQIEFDQVPPLVLNLAGGTLDLLAGALPTVESIAVYAGGKAIPLVQDALNVVADIVTDAADAQLPPLPTVQEVSTALKSAGIDTAQLSNELATVTQKISKFEGFPRL